jgi:hypothetical protein
MSIHVAANDSNNNQSSNLASLPTTAKAQTSKEVIAANVKLLIEQLEAGHSEALTAYLTAMGRFHRYSLSNCLEIARQMPSASRVAGLYAWNQLGRKVKKGSKGIRILAPVVGIRRKKNSEAEKDITKQNEPVLVGFRPAYVFVGVYRERQIDFILAQGITLEFKDTIAPALGMSYGGKIVILPDQAEAEEFSTLVHEAAHELIHKSNRRTAATTTVRETEAEAIAFVIGTTIGLDNGRSSASYIQLYHGNAALLTESLEVVKQTSALILSAIENPAVSPEQAAAQPDSQPSTTQDGTDAATAEVA